MVVRFLLLAFFVFGFGLTRRVNSHEESGEWSCVSNSKEMHIQADFKPGIITLDGCADDWEDIDGSEFSLRPALDPDENHEYKDGKMTVKALHDGNSASSCSKLMGTMSTPKGTSKKAHRWLSCSKSATMLPIIIWAVVKNKRGLVPTRLAKAMKSTLCISLPETLYREGFTVEVIVALVLWLMHMLGTHTVDTLMEWVLLEIILVDRITGKEHGGTVALQIIQVLWRKTVLIPKEVRREHIISNSLGL
ncbi:hypothetical protein E1A91_A12G134300v1 [Gossypium mustelinum]|uniref:Uncharacterized protein n=1 Tax=Gossypium mustelinum TaxID=34275 RepID=A0A5D2WTX8_GOSMU|nr:hypothetical protein E1A91_A12G134300v1 [Gossypium mustelinum]